MTKGKTKKILLSILLCGCFANYAQAAETYTTYDVTAETETVTYTDADGNEQQYSYTVKTLSDVTNNLATTEYGTGNDVKYYAWTDDGSGNMVFGEAESSSSADITVYYTSGQSNINNNGGDITVSGDFAGYAGIGTSVVYNHPSSSAAATIESIAGNFIGNSFGSYDYGGAITNVSRSTSYSATIGEITGNFIGNHADGDGPYGGAIYNESISGSAASIGNITGDFIGNYLTNNSYGYESRGGAIYNFHQGTTEDGAATIGKITGSFIGNYVSGNYARYGGAVFNANWTGSSADTVASIEGIKGDFINNYVLSTLSYGMGGALFNEGEGGTASIGAIEGDFIGNYIDASLYAAGGAVSNESRNDGTAKITSIEGSFTGNYVTAGGDYAYGGAVFNRAQASESDIGAVTGDFIGNYAADSGSGLAAGGAIANLALAEASTSVATEGATAKIDSITAKENGFLYNYALSESSDAAGGAIANRTDKSGGTASIGAITADFVGNYANGSGLAAGGAIENVDNADAANGAATIGDITGSFIANSVTSTGSIADGGAIINIAMAESGTATIGSITGDFIGNSATAAADHAEGGAIFNDAVNYETDTVTIGDITGSFIGNYATSTGGDATGGAIYNEHAEIGSITASDGFLGNYAESSGGAAKGGAIYASYATFGDIKGDFLGNYAKGDTALGGAIYNEEGELTVTGAIGGNHAEGSSEAYGGAIYNAGTITLNASAISNNYVTGGDAKGGAIYNAKGGTVNINAESDMTISGNYAGSSDNSNVLYGEEGSVTNFNMSGSSITLMDNLDGDEGYEVNVSGDGVGSTTFYFLSDAEKSNISFNNTTLNTINNEVKTYSVNKFTVAGDFNMVADVDLANETMDRFVTNGNNYGDASGSLNVSGMNLISDTTADRVGIYFAEPGLKENVTSSVGTLPGSEQQTAYTPLYQYNVSYDKNYDGSWGDDGGYFVFDKTGNNPAAMMPTIAQMGLFNAMNMMFEYSFEHSDYYMKLPSETRLAIREKAKAARAEKLAAKNGTTAEEEAQKIDDARAEEMASREGDKFYDHDNVLPVYDQHELTRPGAWVKTFATKESVPFTGKFTAKDKYYGGIIGVDTDFREDKKGWGNVFTGYAGYQGIHQSYSGGSIRQDGGLLGATETFYKKNFYTAWTIAAASTSAKGRNMYGHESSRLYTYGIATKSGWNLEYDGGKYIVLPTFMASYTTVDMRDYTNAAGLKVNADDMRAVQLNPNIKWIRNYNNGWQPYLTAGEVWTVGQKSRVRVDGTKLDELHLRPYTEYGLGVQKRWAHDYDGYAEFLGHAGGRRGFLAKLGFRWTFN